MFSALIQDVLVILTGGLAAAWVCRRWQLPVLVGYLMVGALLGGGALAWVGDEQREVRHVAEIGAFLLLFSIGLELTIEELLRMGRSLLVGGGLQVLLVAAPTAGLLTACGLSWQAAVLLAAAASFSSTVLVFKSLAEWGQTATPHGKHMVSILLFQDAALVPLLLVTPLLGHASHAADPWQWAGLAGKSAVLVLAVLVCRRVLMAAVVPRLVILRSPELLVLFVLVVLGGATWSCNHWGLPPALGAFGSGLIFSGNRLTRQVDALTFPFREAFSAIFFVSLGLLLAPQVVWEEPLSVLAGFAWILVIKTLAALLALRAAGLPWKAAASTGVGLAHLGEFSFLLAIFGVREGLVPEHEYQRWLSVGVGSLMLTPLLLQVGLRRTHKLETPAEPSATLPPREAASPHLALVVGIGPVGRLVASQLEIGGWDVCLIDLSPVNLQPFAQQGFRTVAGDGSDIEVLRRARGAEAGLAVICVPDDEAALRAVKTFRVLNRHARIVVRCRYRTNVATLRQAGAEQVISEEVEAMEALRRALA